MDKPFPQLNPFEQQNPVTRASQSLSPPFPHHQHLIHLNFANFQGPTLPRHRLKNHRLDRLSSPLQTPHPTHQSRHHRNHHPDPQRHQTQDRHHPANHQRHNSSQNSLPAGNSKALNLHTHHNPCLSHSPPFTTPVTNPARLRNPLPQLKLRPRLPQETSASSELSTSSSNPGNLNALAPTPSPASPSCGKHPEQCPKSHSPHLPPAPPASPATTQAANAPPSCDSHHPDTHKHPVPSLPPPLFPHNAPPASRATPPASPTPPQPPTTAAPSQSALPEISNDSCRPPYTQTFDLTTLTSLKTVSPQKAQTRRDLIHRCRRLILNEVMLHSMLTRRGKNRFPIHLPGP